MCVTETVNGNTINQLDSSRIEQLENDIRTALDEYHARYSDRTSEAALEAWKLRFDQLRARARSLEFDYLKFIDRLMKQEKEKKHGG
ncbi:MAG: hypothetical protein M3Q63_00505 [bacterium]|nr:hypothetical protein [bacterium]